VRVLRTAAAQAPRGMPSTPPPTWSPSPPRRVRRWTSRVAASGGSGELAPPFPLLRPLAGNFKRFPVLVRMLLSAMRQQNDSVALDLLTYSDLVGGWGGWVGCVCADIQRPGGCGIGRRIVCCTAPHLASHRAPHPTPCRAPPSPLRCAGAAEGAQDGQGPPRPPPALTRHDRRRRSRGRRVQGVQALPDPDVRGGIRQGALPAAAHTAGGALRGHAAATGSSGGDGGGGGGSCVRLAVCVPMRWRASVLCACRGNQMLPQAYVRVQACVEATVAKRPQALQRHPPPPPAPPWRRSAG
jgi:hypothetical protein